MAGELSTDLPTRNVYATDASIYQQIPAAVAIPREDADIQVLVEFANEFKIGLIPRTAGTSLAGQVVGSGIVVDVSRHFTQVVEVDTDEQTVRVQPGVIRDELNRELKSCGLFFAPETSTSNRAMIGGMLGNNSCGSNSIVHGTTRDHVLEVTGILGNGARATFGPISLDEFRDRIANPDSGVENRIYKQIFNCLSPMEVQEKIRAAYPKRSIRRRNMGYAIDLLLDTEPFGGTEPFNLAKLIAGSEGTLFFATEIKLNCLPLEPQHTNLICAHFHSVSDALEATQLAMRHRPYRCELIDSLVIDGARRNLLQQRALSFLEGEPAAILLVEIRDRTPEVLEQQVAALTSELERSSQRYAAPVLIGSEAEAAWSLRKAGLGVVNNCSGTNKPTTIIEDAAVDLVDLPNFIAEVDTMLADEFNTVCVHYGHAGAGELHLRPHLDHADDNYPQTVRKIAERFAQLVKKYHGCLSGEHGDGRLRSRFIPMMLGDEVYELLKSVKHIFDPNNLLNPEKIVEAAPTETHLKQLPANPSDQNSLFRFGDERGLVEAASMCSGSGDCRKSQLAGGTMCPSYMATRNENDTTRARANLLRQWLLNANGSIDNIEDHDVRDILELCLSCKGCKSECPSNVDMARLKAEFTQSYFDKHGTPTKAKLLGSFGSWCRRLTKFSRVINSVAGNSVSGGMLKRVLGIHPNRSLPKLANKSLRNWFCKRKQSLTPSSSAARIGRVFLFCDEFTNHLDVHIGQAAIELLELLGYKVILPNHAGSGRSAISAGMVRDAKFLAEQNVCLLSEQLEADDVLVGIEPSALLTMRDEYPDLVDTKLATTAAKLAQQTLLIDEFIAQEVVAGKITPEDFNNSAAPVMIHGHCHQKALTIIETTRAAARLATSAKVELLDSGCCGMAGSFGYESDKYELSMQIGELSLFPTVRNASADTIIIATGTSCRHQIADGTGTATYHLVEFLRQQIKSQTYADSQTRERHLPG